MNDEVVAYIRANRDRYTRDAITATLLSAGHDPVAVEADWVAVEAGAGAGADWTGVAADVPPTSTGAGRFIKGYTLLMYILGLGFQGLTVVSELQTAGSGYGSPNQVLGSVVGFALYAGLGFLAVRWIRTRVDTSRPTTGMAVAAGCLVPALIFGICTAASIPVYLFLV